MPESDDTLKLEAAEAFVNKWCETVDPDSHAFGADLDCTEANTMARLFEVFNFTNTAAQLMKEHLPHCEGTEQHPETDAPTTVLPVFTLDGSWSGGGLYIEYVGINLSDAEIRGVVAGNRDADAFTQDVQAATEHDAFRYLGMNTEATRIVDARNDPERVVFDDTVEGSA
ncbi:hypothetical protein [Streptomyces sp. NPDC086776]|uniref:hypothetical protein n=1 Tax=Streptomyces sp. NPDC086776 TaxID=3365756 RepID=UPI00381B8BB9